MRALRILHLIAGLVILLLSSDAAAAPSRCAPSTLRPLEEVTKAALIGEAIECADAGSWGETIATLEQARALYPDDRQVAAALRFALMESRRIELEAARDTPLLQGEPAALRPIRAFGLLSSKLWGAVGVTLLWGLALLTYMRRRTRPLISSTSYQLLAASFALLLVIPVAALFGVPSYLARVRPALLVDISDAPRIAPDSESPAAQVPNLYPGAAVRVTAARGTWRQIQLANRAQVWVHQDALRKLDPRQPEL